MASGSEGGKQYYRRCVAVEEDDVDSGFSLICDGIIVCQQYLLAHQFQGTYDTDRVCELYGRGH